MSERIDHAKAADDLLRRLATHPAPSDDLDVEWGFREAQIHATLALVEQQRIANLIALHRHEVKYGIGSWSRLYAPRTEELLPEIAEALNLGNP